jgi:threonine dehydrogenase-like Zn-dependent dehydrogenase
MVYPNKSWDVTIVGDYQPYGEYSIIKLSKIPAGIGNNITIRIDGVDYVVNITGGNATLRLNNLTAGKHNGTVVFAGNATDPVAMLEKISELTNGEMADITINNVNVPDTEMTSVLCTKNTGTVYFFSMATSFTKSALGAEGVGSDVTMIIGNGYTKGHAEITLQELRENEELRKIFEELYA